MRCKQYNFHGVEYDILPIYLSVNGNKIPTCNREGNMIPKERMAELGILVRIDAIAEDGKQIIESHGDLIDGQWIEVIDKQMTSEEHNAAITSEELHQRSTSEKLRDNKCIDLINDINALVPELAIQINESVADVSARAIALGADSNGEALLKLLTLSSIVPSLLPTEKHVIE